ncbi:predicted protein [Pyrenophora tritici-repentis Pt-1C-BFP]|uniref:Uncharacterized protein n=1 Tax=Pyrenophora tritici-repentis (strain Pt-1C-BFP) TaxID=426418 RepID=B2WL03_PYRTR|nr:uncharacterized protein PTRG_10663 [Pyrenophora tritici-repentis Pt-1C-BFP]EDU43713.1 predicted protein [Pyrenophora tritici-repentis Pt-1C-BFP]
MTRGRLHPKNLRTFYALQENDNSFYSTKFRDLRVRSWWCAVVQDRTNPCRR